MCNCILISVNSWRSPVKKEVIRNTVSKIKYLYILVYMVCFSLFNFVYVNHYLYSQTQLLYQGLIVIGLFIIAADMFSFGIMLKTKYSTVLVLFFCACACSVLFNLKYDPVGNVKVIMWMLVQTFVFAAIDREQSAEHHKKYFGCITESVGLVWFVGCLISVAMFFCGYSEYIENASVTVGYYRLGFVDGRLFGVFTDPNFTAVCVLFCMAMTLSRIFSKKHALPVRIYHIVVLVVDFLYVLLSRSRTAHLGMIAAAFVVVFFLIKRLCENKGIGTIKKILAMCIGAILSVTLLYGTISVLDEAASKVYLALNVPDQGSDGEVIVDRPDDGSDGNITNNRISIWRDYIDIFLEKPVFGTGPRNGLSYAQEIMPDSYIVEKQYQYHNGYLAVLVGSGIVGTCLLFAYILLVIKKIIVYLWTKSSSGNEHYTQTVFLSAVLIIGAISAFPLHMLFFNNSASDVMFWFVLGYVLYCVTDKTEQKTPLAYRLTSIFRPKCLSEE